MRERVKRFLKRRVLPFSLILVGAFVLFVAAFWLKCAFVKPSVSSFPTVLNHTGSPTANFGKNARALEDSYFSYPEWYIVWSYEGRAQYLPKNLPSGFPYFTSIRQYWRSYCFICGLTQSRHQFNFGDHLSSFVLGGSFTLEYSIRGAYEQTIGRLSEWTSSHELVEEDAYAARVAREYADFVYIRPFYEFHFAHALKQLWKETPFWEKHPLRKWERKFILSTDYGLEAIYAAILQAASHITYGIESADTYTWVENAPPFVLQEFPRVKIAAQIAPESYLVIIPRYQEFTALALSLAKRNVHFAEISGNDEIMLSIVAPASWNYDLRAEEANLLFIENFLTRDDVKRVVLECPVRSLHLVLKNLTDRGIKVEHLYDY